MGKIYIIQTDNGKLFFVGGKRWSEERPDAAEFRKKSFAAMELDAVQRKMPDNFSVQRAEVVEEEKGPA